MQPKCKWHKLHVRVILGRDFNGSELDFVVVRDIVPGRSSRALGVLGIFTQSDSATKNKLPPGPGAVRRNRIKKASIFVSSMMDERGFK